MNGTLTMKRHGTFTVKAVGPNHCGTKEDLTIQYHVIIKCGMTLDARGFLFDQLTVAQFFDSIKRTSLSCEQLTISCARKLLALIHKENTLCSVKSLRVTLSPEPFAADMTFESELTPQDAPAPMPKSAGLDERIDRLLDRLMGEAQVQTAL